MTLHDVEKELRSQIPEAGVIAIQHSLTTNIVGEMWAAQVYLKTEKEQNNLDVLIASGKAYINPQNLVKDTLANYKAEASQREARIESLKRQLVALEGAWNV